jgi:hypothetical protein
MRNPKFEMILENPQHGIAKNISSDKSPIGIELFAQQIGNWVIKINPLVVPYPNFPFALTLAKGGEKQLVASNISSPPVSGQSVQAGIQNPGKPISQILPLSSTAVPASSPVIGNTGITGGAPTQVMLAPVLFPILNMGGLPTYEVRWMPQAGQDGYILQEASAVSFSDAKEIYKGNLTNLACSNKPVGTHFYRVCSYKGSDTSDWSDMQSTNVIHAP